MDNYVSDIVSKNILAIHLIFETNHEVDINIVDVDEETEDYESQIIALLTQ